MLDWTPEAGVARHFIAPGKPTEDGICEAFNARRRDERLEEMLVFSREHARAATVRWVAADNRRRPHPAPGSATPAADPARFTAIGHRLREMQSIRRSPIVPSAQPRRFGCRASASDG